ncbi:DUF6082 family protein [Nonomuraea sp. NPDC049421]|uniref:DUF6082 family protein n=1 Tax=Nonomuraea sp. NPDC049421 TaxID=3155275 RepID=UPI00343BD264
MTPRNRRTPSLLMPLLLTIAAVCAAATLLSPLLLDLLVPASLRWQELSAIGETYGAASAVLSAFALVAIGVSLFLQAREMRFAREDASRSHHFQLMQLQIENPALHNALGRVDSGLDPATHLYLNLVLSYWEMLFNVGDMPEPVLVKYAQADIFSTETGRRFWVRTREHRRAVAKNRRALRFVAALDLAYHRSLEERPAPPPDAVVPAARSGRPAALHVAAAAAVAVAGISWLSRVRKRRAGG